MATWTVTDSIWVAAAISAGLVLIVVVVWWARRQVFQMVEARPVLIVAIGSDAELSLDLTAFRAVRTETKMDFLRIRDATLNDLKVALDRERGRGRTTNVHLAVHAGPTGVEMGGQIVDAVALSEILDGVQILVIAGCSAAQMGDFLGVAPYVVSMNEAVTHTDAALWSRYWWTAIGNRMTPDQALREALRRSPSGMSEYVVHSW